MAHGSADVTAEDIDNILDEIEQNEEKSSRNAPTNGANWKQILTQLQKGNITYVKSLITTKDIDVNEQDPANGMTVLIYATVIGNYELVKLVCNFGANVHTKDHSDCDALDYAQRYGRYAITELLFYRQLSGSLGKDLKDIATSIHDKNDEAKRLKSHSKSLHNDIITAMKTAIQWREPFSPDLLYYAWYFYLEECEKVKKDPVAPWTENDKSSWGSLWVEMMTAFQQILCNTSDKEGWKWLKGYFINSLIWFLPHPKNKLKNEDNDDDNDMEYILSTTLFYELLTRVRKESKVQSDLLLKEKIDAIKTKTPQEWETLITYNISTEFSKNARQDVCGCITPKYNEDELSEERYPPSTHFSAKKHYDTNIYLNELLFRANIMDTMFQSDMKKITKEINSVTGFDSQYRAGPVKTVARSQIKVENDYIDEDYPTAAKILDINRCAIQFESIDAMMKYIHLFTDRIGQKQAHSIVAIIRCKNGWRTYNPQQPAYTDVKLNVLVQSPTDGTIVAEIQLLLKLMSAFKKKAHKLYGVERKFELVYNFNQLQRKMSQFKDLFGENIMIDLLKRNELESFKTYWSIITNEEDLTNSIDALVPEIRHERQVPLFYLLMVDHGEDIYQYLVKHFSHVLCKALETYFEFICEQTTIGFNSFVNDMYKSQENKEEFTKDALVFKFLQKVYHFTGVNADAQSEILTKLFTVEEKYNKVNKSFVSTIAAAYSSSKICAKSFNYIIDNKAVTYEDKIKIFGAPSGGLLSALEHSYMDHIAQILFYFNNRKDKQRLMEVLKWQPKKEVSKTGFLFICSKVRDQRSLLPFLLNNPMLNKEEVYELMTVADDKVYTSVELALQGSTFNTHLVLRYINNTDTIVKMVTKDFVNESSRWKSGDGKYYWRWQCVLILLKYIAHDKAQLVHVLGKLGLFEKVMKKRCVELMKWILYESGLTPQDIMGFMSKKCIFDDPYANQRYVPDATCPTEIIRYFKDDKSSLMQILEMVYKRSLYTMLHSKYGSNETRQILFYDSALDVDTMCDFLKRNEKGRGVKESTFFKLVQGDQGDGVMNTIDLVKYLPLHHLKSLLLQKHTKHGKEYLAKFETKEALETIYSAFVSKGTYEHSSRVAMIKPLLEITRTAASKPGQREIAGRYEEYVRFCERQNKRRMSRRSIGTRDELDCKLFEDIGDESHPLRTACICGDDATIKEFLGSWLWDKDGKNLFDILNKPKLIHKLFCNGNDDEVNIKMLLLLVLDNPSFSDAQKFALINATTPPFEDDKKNAAIIITPAFVDTTIALREHVLKYFEKQEHKEYVLRLLQDKVSWRNKKSGATELNISPLYAICRSSVNKTPPVQFIIDCPLLSDEQKIKLFSDSFVDIVKLNAGLSLNVLQFISVRDDSSTLLTQFLSQKDSQSGETVLMLMMKGKASKDAESLLYILDHAALTYEYKRKLVFEDVYTFDKEKANSYDYKQYGPYQHVFALACKAYHDTRFIAKIFDYFDVEKDVNFDDKTLCDILVKIETAQHLQVVLNGIGDNKLMKRLLTNKSEDLNAFGATVFEHCQHYGPVRSTTGSQHREIRNRRKFEMIQKYVDYLQLDESLESGDDLNVFSFNQYAEYWTNPWITCCQFGKMETMMKLLQCVIRQNETKLTTFLTQNYNLLNGNDWMMTLFANGYEDMILKIMRQLENAILQQKEDCTFVDVMTTVLMHKNTIKKKTFLMMIANDDDTNCALIDAILAMLKDKKSIAQVLNCKDDSGNTCVDYAAQNTKQMMLNYRK